MTKPEPQTEVSPSIKKLQEVLDDALRESCNEWNKPQKKQKARPKRKSRIWACSGFKNSVIYPEAKKQ